MDDAFPIDRDLLRALLTQVDELIMAGQPDGTITFVSPAVRTVLGYEPRAIEGHSFLEFLHPDEHDETLESIARWTDRSGSPAGQVQRLRAANGDWVPLHYDIVIGDTVAPFGGAVVTWRSPDQLDPARRELVQRALNEDRLVRLATVFVRRPVAQFHEGLGEALRELAGLDWVTRVSVWRLEDDQLERTAMWEAASGAPQLPLPPRVPADGTPLLRRLSGGEEVHVRSVAHLPDDWQEDRESLRASGVRSLLAVPMTIEGRCTGFVMVEVTLAEIAFDVSQITTLRSAAAILAAAFERHGIELELARRAQTDPLTGLGNRWAFVDLVSDYVRDIARGESLGLAAVMLDIDRFTLVNDAFGHDVGDRLIAAVAERIRHAIPPSVALFRLHGDEFLFAVPDAASAASAIEISRAAVDAVDPPFEVDGRAVSLSLSAGVVHVTGSSVDATELMQRVDLVMQEAHVAGGDRIGVESEALHVQAAARLDRQTQLQEAIEHGDVEPFFQGEWDLEDGRLVGAEALARWHHPSRGLVAASEFIPMAEECGLIGEIGSVVLREACRDATNWEQPVDLRVNLSARQLHDPDLVAAVRRILDESGLAPERLCLELTESALMTDPEHAVSVLDALRSEGIELAVDDFGTGYSSLHYLKRLPVTCLKIDQSFVAGLPDVAEDRAIVRAVVQLAATLDLSVTAEGVENEAQRDALLDLGCVRAQGFLLSRPEPASAFADRLAPV